MGISTSDFHLLKNNQAKFIIRKYTTIIKKNTKDAFLEKIKYTTLTPRGIKSKSLSLRYQSVQVKIKFGE